MIDSEMGNEFPDSGQRLAVCGSLYEEKKSMKIQRSFKGNIVKEKTERGSYLMGKPVFEKSIISVDDIPINDNLTDAFKTLTEGDKNPFMFVSEMKLGEDHPTAYDDIMTVDWGESFVNKLDNAPFPVSALGHTNVDRPAERVENQGYVFGGKVDKEKESMFLLNYLLPGQTPESKELAEKTKREMKAGMLSTSISNMQKYVLVHDEDAQSTKWYVTESISGQRNDIVEHDLTGSDAAIVARSMKASKAEVTAQKNKTGDNMTKVEMLEKLQTLKANGDLSIADIAESFGLELVTDEHKQAIESLKAIHSLVGENAEEEIKSLKETADRVENLDFEENKMSALKEVFKEKENLLENAKELFTLKLGSKEECIAEAKRVSELKTLKDLASKMAADMSRGVTPPVNTGNKPANGIIEM
jgi:hypothetical protein